MGRSGFDGCELGVIDGAGGGTVSALDLYNDCEEGSDGEFLDGGACYGGALWRLVLPFPLSPIPSFSTLLPVLQHILMLCVHE